MADCEFTKSVNLSDAERLRMLTRMDESARSQAQSIVSRGKDKRCEPRLSYRAANVAVLAQHPGGSTSKLIVCMRNLSANGMGFVHGGFLHHGSRCRALLNRLDGTPMVLEGVVVNCRHVSGRLHEIGVKFDRRIELLDFMTRAELREADLCSVLNLPEIHGRVVFLGGQGQLLSDHLRAIGVDLLTTPSLQRTIDAVRSSDTSIVLIAVQNVAATVTATQRLRESGYNGRVVFVTSRGTVGARNVDPNLVDAVIDSTIDLQDLFDLLKKLADEDGGISAAAPRTPPAATSHTAATGDSGKAA